MDKHWLKQAVALLQASRDPVPHETNEIDWKVDLSGNKERLIEHLIAFANLATMYELVRDAVGTLYEHSRKTKGAT
jgi:hypothetical protein